MPSNPIKRGNSAFRRARREARVGRTRPGAAAPTCPPILGHPNAPARTPAFDPADFDRLLRSAVMRRTLGRSPVSLMTAMTDWLGHLALAPSVCWRLAEHAAGRSADFWRDAMIREAFEIHAADVGHIPLHQQALAWGVSRKVALVQMADNFMPFKWMSIAK